MQPFILYTLASVLLVSLLSFVGLAVFAVKADKLRKILIYFVSFSAGALFGDAFIHLLPQVVNEYGFTLKISFSLLAGLLLFFVIEQFVQWHHCHEVHTSKVVHSFAIMNLIGDTVHNFLDGLIIGASYLLSVPAGIATTIAVVLHEIPQEISDFGVLLHGGFSRTRALFLNFVTALSAVLGAAVALALGFYISNITAYLIPIAAAGFIYIAGSDLIPELHKELNVKKVILQILFFILGVAIMAALLLIE